MTLRAAVVGCGALANGAHLPNLQASDMFDLAVTCDVNEAAALDAAKRWGAERTSTDWHEVVAADDVDIIVLCTHTNLRGELICAAFDAGKPVYTEKPLASSRSETLRILHAAHRSGVPLCVGHNRRSGPSVIEFKRLIEKARAEGADRGAILDRATGKRNTIAEESQTQLLMRINDDARTWKLWIFEEDQGVMLAEMVHFVDLAMHFMTTPPVEVYAMGSTRGNFTQLIRFTDGSMATLFHTLAGNFDYPKERFEVGLRNVYISLDHHLEIRQRGMETEPEKQVFPLDAGADLTDKEGIDAFFDATEKLQEMRRAGEELPIQCAGPNKGHLAHLEQFGRHIQGEAENPCPPDESAAVMNVALKLFDSARLGLPVKVAPEDYDFGQTEHRSN